MAAVRDGLLQELEIGRLRDDPRGRASWVIVWTGVAIYAVVTRGETVKLVIRMSRTG